MNRLIVGVDTNTFYFAATCLNEGQEPWFVPVGQGKKHYELGKHASERIPKLFLAFYEWLSHTRYGSSYLPKSHYGFDEVEVWVEDYAFAGGSRSTAEIAQCVEAVKDACAMAKVPCYTVNNSQWKKEIVKKGNASKDETRAFLIAHYSWVPDNLDPPDLYDAAAVAIVGSNTHAK